MRIAVFGQAAFGKDVFEALRDAGEELVGVSTPRQPDGARPDPLAEAAREAGIPVIPTRDLRKDGPFDQYQAWAPELLVFAFVTDIVRKNVLDVPTHGAIQYHPSLLPKHRGRSAMAWPVIAGETKTGVTIFWVDEGIDTGPILLQREEEIRPDDSVGSLYFDRLYPLGVEALVEAVRVVREGTAPRIEQDHSAATYDPPLGPEHAIVDWSRPGRVVHNHVRGCDPQPGASCLHRRESIRLFNAAFADGYSEQTPGTVTGTAAGAIEVAVIGGTLTIGRVQQAGERKVAAMEVVQVGDVLERGL